MNKVIKNLADVLKRLPSEYRDDYPKSVPNYVISNIERFNNTYKANVSYIRNYFHKLEKENEELRATLMSTYLGAERYIQTSGDFWVIDRQTMMQIKLALNIKSN